MLRGGGIYHTWGMFGMKQREWFVLGVRLLGVWVVIAGIGELVALAEVRFGLVSPLHTELGAYLLHAAVDFAVGAYLLSGGSILATFAFGAEGSDEPEERGSADSTSK